MKHKNRIKVNVNEELLALPKAVFLAKCKNNIDGIGIISPNLSIEELYEKAHTVDRTTLEIREYAAKNDDETHEYTDKFTDLLTKCNTELKQILKNAAYKLLEKSGMPVIGCKEVNTVIPEIGFFTIPKKWFHGGIHEFVQIPQEFINTLHSCNFKCRLIEVTHTVILSKKEVLTRIATYDGSTRLQYQLTYSNSVFNKNFETTINCPGYCTVDYRSGERDCIFLQIIPE